MHFARATFWRSVFFVEMAPLVTVTPLSDGPPGIFRTLAAGDTRPPLTRGITARLVVRAAALAESTPLFTPPPGLLAVEAYFFQAVTDGDPVFGAMSRLAAQLRLDFDATRR